MRVTPIALTAALLLATGCTFPLFDDSCGPELRVTSARGELVGPGGVGLGSAELRLIEVRGEPPPRRVLPVIMGPGVGSGGAPLADHVTSAEVIDASAQVLVVLPAQPGPGDQVLDATPVPVADEATFAVLRDAFLRGGAVLRLRTDLPGIEEVRTPLAPQEAGNWGRNSCS